MLYSGYSNGEMAGQKTKKCHAKVRKCELTQFCLLCYTLGKRERGETVFKTETHMHTAEVSGCAKVCATDMVELYHQAGYDTVFVSDHFHYTYLKRLGDIPWDEKIMHFLSGYRKEKVKGDELGICVLLAAEFTFFDAPNDYLAYGINEEFLIAHPELETMTAAEFFELAKENHIFVVQAHPFRDKVCYPTPEIVDGIEVINSNPRHDNYDEDCEMIAQKHGLCRTAGSDAHREDDACLAGVLTQTKITSTKEYVASIQSGRVKLFREKML